MKDESNPIRLLLVDDHPIFRRGLREILETRPGFEVVAEAGSAPEARALMAEAKPDAVFLDIEMPGENGLELCEQLHEAPQGIRSIVLTMHDKPGYVRRAMQAGASGYLLKDRPAAEILSAVERVVAGELVFPPVPARLAWDNLSQREREVACLIARGYGNPQIAAILGIAERTVEDHRLRVRIKLGCSSSIEIAEYIRANGISDCEAFESSKRPSSRPPTR
jgi:DNA-binding NarL/FixJ family response regulator